MVLFVSALVAAASFTLGLTSRVASAGQVSTLQSQASRLSELLVRQQLEVGALQQQYSVLSARVASDASATNQVESQIASDRREVARATEEVRIQALDDYMGAGDQSPSSELLLFSDRGEQQQDLAEYQSIAMGKLTTALDQLHTATSTLAISEAELQHRQEADSTALAQQTTVLGQANELQGQLQASETLVTGQLATAVAQQAAAQRAAAAAAVQAAQAAADRSSQQRNISLGTGPLAPSGTMENEQPGPGDGPIVTDPSLGPFLQCVVQAESGGNYGAVSVNGVYRGAFQFSQATWNMAAAAAGLTALIGEPPNLASKADQDAVAVALYALDGEQPWVDSCHP